MLLLPCLASFHLFLPFKQKTDTHTHTHTHTNTSSANCMLEFVHASDSDLRMKCRVGEKEMVGARGKKCQSKREGRTQDESDIDVNRMSKLTVCKRRGVQVFKLAFVPPQG